MTEQLELISGEAPGADSFGRLDETTKATGRVGVSRARAALAEATRRSAARDAARLARRDQELARRVTTARSTKDAAGATPIPPGRREAA